MCEEVSGSGDSAAGWAGPILSFSVIKAFTRKDTKVHEGKPESQNPAIGLVHDARSRLEFGAPCSAWLSRSSPLLLPPGVQLCFLYPRVLGGSLCLFRLTRQDE